MLSKLPVTQLKAPPAAPIYAFSSRRELCRFVYCIRNSSEKENFRFKLVGQSFRDRWKLNEIDTNAVQEKFNTWLAKTQNFFNEVTSPLGTGQGRKPVSSNVTDAPDIEDIFMAEQTIDSRTSRGILSLAAIISIEQLSRMA